VKIIASQAMITATFSLIQQLVNMKALPPLKMLYTSETIQGQVYVPAANWTLMVGTVIIVAAFSDLSALTNAYGFAVATVMLSTTLLLAVQMRFVKQWPVVVAVSFFIVWGFVDGLFWGASLKKVPLGAWVPLMIGVILYVAAAAAPVYHSSILYRMLCMSMWTWAKVRQDLVKRSSDTKPFFRDSRTSSTATIGRTCGTSFTLMLSRRMQTKTRKSQRMSRNETSSIT
jgi:KUP system potassium uptake protein